MQNGQPNDLTCIVVADNDIIIGHIAIGCDIGSAWLGELNRKCVSLRIMVISEVNAVSVYLHALRLF